MPGEQLLLINPRRKKRRKNPRSRHRRRHKNTRRIRRRARRAGEYRIRRRRVKNPRSYRRRHRHRNPRMRRRRHRNPISLGGVKSALVPAAIGAAGAVATDYAYTYISPYLPSAITSIPYASQLTKLATAFGIGMVARKFMGHEKGNAVLAGALTVTVYNILAGMLGGTPGMAGLGAYMNSGMAGLAGPNPAPFLKRPGMGRVGRVGRVGAYIPRGTLSGLAGATTAGGAYSSGDGSFDASEMFS